MLIKISSPMMEISVFTNSLRNERSKSLLVFGLDVISVMVSGMSEMMGGAAVEVPLLMLLCLRSVVLLLHSPLQLLLLLLLLLWFPLPCPPNPPLPL